MKVTSPAMASRSLLKALLSIDYRNVLMLNLLMTFGGGAGYYLRLPAIFPYGGEQRSQ